MPHSAEYADTPARRKRRRYEAAHPERAFRFGRLRMGIRKKGRERR